MPWNIPVFDSTGKIKDARVSEIPPLTTSGNPLVNELIAVGTAVKAFLLTVSGNPLINEVTALGNTNQTDIAPLIFGPRVGRRNYGDNNQGTGVNYELNQEEVDALGLCHFSIINGQPNRGDGFKDAIQDAVVNLHAVNPDHKVYQYFIIQEIGQSFTGNTHDLLVSGDGPPGQTVAGGSPVPENCWYGRDGDGNLEEVFELPSGANVATNITAFVVADGQGRFFPEAYIDTIFAENWVDPFNPQLDGYWCDVIDHRVRKNSLDYKGTNSNNNAKSNWRDNGLGEEVSDAYREGHRVCMQTIKDNYPTKNFLLGGNTTTWPMETTEENPRLILNSEGLAENHPEYVGLLHHSWQESQSHEAGSPSFCGMYTNGNRTAFGTPRLSQNNIHFLVRHLSGPKQAGNQFQIEISGNQYTFNLLVGSNVTAAAMVVPRFGMAQSVLCGAYFGLTPVGNAQYNVTIHIDESGLINTGTTGLSKGWLGAPLEDFLHDKEWDAEAAVPWILGSNGIYKIEYAGGLVVVSFDKGGSNDNTAITGSDNIPVVASGNLNNGEIPSGVFKEFSGHQDPTINAGRVINTTNFPSGYPLRNMDARFFVRI